MPKKSNISYTQPQEPAFITRMKAEIGYTIADSPTIETKRQSIPSLPDEDTDERDEEKPVVVVLAPGDISAEEAERIKAQENCGEVQSRANLDDRIVFRVPSKTTKLEPKKRLGDDDGGGKRKKLAKDNKSLLSFDEGEDDDAC